MKREFTDALFGTHAAADHEPTPKRLQRELLTHTPLWRWLPYDEFDPANGIFVNRDSIAIAFEVIPITGADDETVKRLHTIFTALELTPAEARILERARTILAKRLRAPGDVMNSPATVREYLRMSLAAEQRKVFLVMFLDAHNRLLAAEPMFAGTLTQTSAWRDSGVLFAAGATLAASDDSLRSLARQSASPPIRSATRMSLPPTEIHT